MAGQLSSAQALSISNFAVTVGMLLFAGMQWWLMRRSEQNRLRERADDQRSALQAAHGGVWAESQRIHLMRLIWEDEDLILAALRGAISPDEVTPGEWAHVSRLLGQLGPEASDFGGAAFAHAYALRRQLYSFMRDVNRATPAENASLRDRREMVVTLVPSLLEWERVLKESIVELDALWQDAVEHSPVAAAPGERKYHKQLHSMTGREVARAMEELARGSPGES